MQSAFLRYFIADIAARRFGEEGRHMLQEFGVSVDVNAAFDRSIPMWRNCATARSSIRAVLTKYTGSHGKSGTSDASAELMGRVRRSMDGQGIIWQIGEAQQGGRRRRRFGGDVYRQS